MAYGVALSPTIMLSSFLNTLCMASAKLSLRTMHAPAAAREARAP